MGKLQALTEEQKREIGRAYSDRQITTTSIADKYGLTRAQVAKIAIEQGAKPRTAKYGATKNERGAPRKCPKCKKAITVRGARFCCYCGADVRSDKELLIERIDKALSYTAFLPQSTCDEMRDVLLEAKRLLKG